MSFRPGQIVLADTNVIIEAHRTGCWKVLANHFAIHTVEKVVEETQTGFQNRQTEQTIDEASLRKACKHIVKISETQRAQFHIDFPEALLDPGERDLIIHAGTLGVADIWLLNSPDMAAVRHAHGRGWIDRLVSLEAMNAHLKFKPKAALRENYSERWLSTKRTNLLLRG